MLGVVQHLENAIGSAFWLGPEHENLKRLEKLKLKADDPIESFPSFFPSFEILLTKGHIGGNKRA